MESWRSAGDVLRWWRTSVLGWTQQQAADRLSVRHSALSNWERGERAISLDLDEVDHALDGGSLLRDLLWSHGTTDGLEPGRIWSWIFDGPSRPVWMWIRSPSSRIVVESEWGVARLEVVFDLGPNGVFLTNGATLPDSPIVVQLSSPGVGRLRRRNHAPVGAGGTDPRRPRPAASELGPGPADGHVRLDARGPRRLPGPGCHRSCTRSVGRCIR